MECSIGNMIRHKRKLLNISQLELSKEINIRQATISELENGKIGNYTTLKKVLESLGLSIMIINNE